MINLIESSVFGLVWGFSIFGQITRFHRWLSGDTDDSWDLCSLLFGMEYVLFKCCF